MAIVVPMYVAADLPMAGRDYEEPLGLIGAELRLNASGLK